jgi:hypothetical protein
MTVADAPTRTAPSTARRAWRPTLAACVALAILYVALSLLLDTGGHLGGADVGSRVATLRSMERHHTLSPDLGYWAERWDPTGALHPMDPQYLTHENGRWVGVTSLPTLYLGYPLYRLGGLRLLLALPIAAAIAAALAARRLSMLLDPVSRGWWAFWLVALATPVALYALDFWDHIFGVALGAWAVVAVVSAIRGGRGGLVWRFALAGLLFGIAATMRTEAFVYAFATIAVGAVVVLRTCSLRVALAAGACAVAAFAVPLGANFALEHAVLGHDLRFERSANAISSAASQEAGDHGTSLNSATGRARVATWTATALSDVRDDRLIPEGLVFTGLLVTGAVMAAFRERRSALLAWGAAGVVLLGRAVDDGWGYVPGLLSASPLAAAGLVWGWRRRSRVVAAIAVVAMPVVWATQWAGSQLSQWGGRYLLVSGFLLAVAAALAIERRDVAARLAVVVLAGSVTAFGFGWLVVKTHGYSDALHALHDRPEPVLVSGVFPIFRHSGDLYGDRRWLNALDDDQRAAAASIVRAAGFDELGYVMLDGDTAPTFPGFCAGRSTRLAFLPHVGLRVTTFHAGRCGG